MEQEINEKLNITLDKETKKLDITYGEAPKALPLREVVPINIKGDIHAPAEFFEKRKSLLNINECHVEVQSHKGIVTLVVNETDHFKHVITGEIRLNEYLKAFSINENKKFNQKELIELLRRNKYFFADKEHHAAIVRKLTQFKTTITTNLENVDDKKGNKTAHMDKSTDFAADLKFKLNIPIYKADDDATFFVEICMDASDASVLFWLESDDLFEIMMIQKQTLLESQMIKLEELVTIQV